MLTQITADKREFIKISQAVGMGFLVMVCSLPSAQPLRSPCDCSRTTD